MSQLTVTAVPGANGAGNLVVSFTLAKGVKPGDSDYVSICKTSMDNSDYITYSYITLGSNVVTVSCEGYEQSGQLEARYVAYSGDILARSSPFTWNQLPTSQATAKAIPQQPSKATVQAPKQSPKSNFIEVMGTISDRAEGELKVRYYYSAAKDGDFIALCQEKDDEGAYLVYSYVTLDTSEVSLDCSGYIDTLKDFAENQDIKCVVRYYNGDSITKLKSSPFFYFDPPVKAPKVPKVKEPKLPSKPSSPSPSPSPSPAVPTYATPAFNSVPTSPAPSIPQRPSKPPSSSSISAPPVNNSPSGPSPSIPQRPVKSSSPSAPSPNNNNNNNNKEEEKKKSKGGFMGKIGKIAKSDTAKGLVQFGLQQVGVSHNNNSSSSGDKDHTPSVNQSQATSSSNNPNNSGTSTVPYYNTFNGGPRINFPLLQIVQREEFPELYTHYINPDYHSYKLDPIAQAKHAANYATKGEPSSPDQEKTWIDSCYFKHQWVIHQNAQQAITWSQLQEAFNVGYLDLKNGERFDFNNLENTSFQEGSLPAPKFEKYHPGVPFSDRSVPAKRFWTKFLRKGGNPSADWAIRELLPNGSISYYTLTTAEFKQRLPSFHPVNVWAGDLHYNFGYNGTFKPAFCWQLSFQNFYNNSSVDGNTQPPSVPEIEGKFEIWARKFECDFNNQKFWVNYRIGTVTLRQLKEHIIPRIHHSNVNSLTEVEGIPVTIGWLNVIYPCQSAYPGVRIPSYAEWRASMPDPQVDYNSGRDYCVDPKIEYCFGHVYWNYARTSKSFLDIRLDIWEKQNPPQITYNNNINNNNSDDGDDYVPSYSSYSSSSSSYSSSSSSSSYSSPSKTSTSSAAPAKEKPKENWYWAKVCNDCNKKCASCGGDRRGAEGNAKLCWQKCGFGLRKDNCVLCGKSFARNAGKLGGCCKSKKSQNCCQCSNVCRDH